MPLNNCEISLILTWSENCVLPNDTKATAFAITDTKLNVLVATLSTQDNVKLLEQLKSGFKRTINWNKYQSEPTLQAQKQYLNHFIDPNFQGAKLFYHLKIRTKKVKYSMYVVIKYYSVMIYGKSFFDHPVKNDLRTYDCNLSRR